MMSQIQYMTAKEAADKWNISHRRVITLCQQNRIPNTAMLGNMWIIPKNAQKPGDLRLLSSVKSNFAKPFVKWAGGKGQLIPQIKKYYPPCLGTKIKKYCEPMVGAGAVLFDILNTYDMDEVLINDTNAELINLYKIVKSQVELLIENLSILENDYLTRNETQRKEYYYNQRLLFNELITNPNDKNALMRASIFVFLNKTCFNGLYRVNRNGLFNVPIGSYKNPTICDRDNLLHVSKLLQNVNFSVGDYHGIENFVDSSTFVYFDPPYRPLTKTSDFTAYNKTDFGDNEQIELGEFINSLANKNICVMASNSDPKNIDENDNFFDDIYSELNIYRVSAKRSINSKGKGRGKIKELLITSY